jgi:Cof subfamily protein (haloacid dehalogenase superfamily)
MASFPWLEGGAMTLKLIATDMDGTLLRDDRTYDYDRMRRLLDEMDARGILFVAASGNQLGQLKNYFAEVGPERINYVSDNGALVTYRGETLAEATLSRTQLSQVITWNNANFAKMENLIILSGDKGAYVSNNVPASIMAETEKYYTNLMQVEKLLDVDDQIFKLSLVWPPTVSVYESVKSLRTVFEGELHATGSGFGSVDVLAHGVNKQTGLVELGKSLNIRPDEMVAFGDNANDLEMLRFVKYPFVMPNAEAFMHDRIKQTALNNNNENGVLDTIEALLDGRLH